MTRSLARPWLRVKNGWEPADEREQVCSWIALDHKEMMLRHWDQTRAVLLADMPLDPVSLGYEPCEVLLALKKDDPLVIRTLTNRLHKVELDLMSSSARSFGPRPAPAATSQGRSLAERYVYSGHPLLWEAGLQWLSNHGIRIVVTVPGKADWRQVTFDEVFGNAERW